MYIEREHDMYLTGKEIVKSGMIVPSVWAKVDDGVTPSFGPDPGGYTLTADVNWERYYLMPGRTVVMDSSEYIELPIDCIGHLFLKSTYSRQGLVLVTNSPVDGGYKGRLTFRLLNTSDHTVTLHGMGGFVQMCIARLFGDTSRYYGRWQQGG
jgi:deoxycytidine triphosphate deaminase